MIQQCHFWLFFQRKWNHHLEKTPVLHVHCSLTIAKTWKQPKCSSVDEQIKNMWDVCVCEYFLAIKRRISCHLGWFEWSSRALSEKAMAPHSSTLAWKIPWTEEPGRLQSMGSLRVGNDWAPSLSLFTFMHWRRKWQPIPVFLPRESQGQGSLVGCRLWGHTELDTTEAT